jgi:hypothetical protein
VGTAIPPVETATPRGMPTAIHTLPAVRETAASMPGPRGAATAPPIRRPGGPADAATPTSAVPPCMPFPAAETPGWACVFVDDFTADVPLGSWPGPYAARWLQYPDDTPDSTGRNLGTPSRWWPSKVLSVHDGLLDFSFHTEAGVALSAAVLPARDGKALNQVYGRYVVRFRADALSGYKAAFLLWPRSEAWPRDGEIDFPEGDLASTIFAALHRQDGTTIDDQDLFASDAPFTGWHIATTDWTPQGVTFSLDGRVLGRATARIPDTPMHWVLQTEACEVHCPDPAATGHLQVDWVAIYALVPPP